MSTFRRPTPARPPAPGPSREQTLSEQRYQELLNSARAFFAGAEETSTERRQAVIDEIKEQMARHGLTVDDLAL